VPLIVVEFWLFAPRTKQRRTTYQKLRSYLLTVLAILGFAASVNAGQSAKEQPKPPKFPNPLNTINQGITAHFAQGLNPTTVIPLISQMIPRAWVRDDILWYNCETVKGQYHSYTQLENWLTLADQYKLNVILNIGNNTLYTNSYDPVAYSNFAGWLAGYLKTAHPCVKAIELTNEPNNNYAQTEGSNWHADYVVLCQDTYPKVKAANSGMIVLAGGGANPGDIEYFQSNGAATDADAWSEHPYPNSQSDYDGSTFISLEQGRVAYAQQYGASTVIMDTEWGYAWTRDPTYFCRRIVLNAFLGIANNDIYEMVDDGSGAFGMLSTSLQQEPGFSAVQNTVAALNGLAVGNTLQTITTPGPNYIYGFDSADGSKSVLSWWDGGGYWVTTARQCTVSWKHPNAKSVSLYNPKTGVSTPLTFNTSPSDPTVVIIDIPVSTSCQMAIIQ
jgi:Cellulase (glycosyl hydrolase family 5)